MDKLKALLQKFIKIMQVIIVISFLTLTYIFGFALCGIFILIFNRKLLFAFDPKKDSYWIDAQSYDLDMHDAFRQT